MIASVALRAKCCDWHAHRTAASEHAPCAVCDRPMPLVKASFNRWPAEYVCSGCRIAIAGDLVRIERKKRGLKP